MLGRGDAHDALDGGVTRLRAAPRSAVVLAAGRSERLAKLTAGRSKALLPIGGVFLLERNVRGLLALGMRRVVVVLGHDAERVEMGLRGLVARGVEFVRAPGWSAGNGASLAAARDAVAGEGSFLVVCGDHMFSQDALAGLARASGPAVLVDRYPSGAAWAEGTRVHLRRGRAIAFSKDLEERAIDCGAFVLPSEVFESQRQAALEGDHSLAGAVTRLARACEVRALPLPAGAWWQDVDTPEDLRAARTLLRRSLGKPSDGPISRHLNRRISTRITMALAPFRIPPGVFSLMTLLVGFWAAWSLSASRPEIGGLFAQAASLLDGVDGETARLHYRSSRRGAVVDDFVDRAVDAAIVAGLCLWIWDDPGRVFRAWIILASALGLVIIHAAIRRRTASLELPRPRSRPLGVLLGGRDSRMALIAVGALAEQPFPTLAAATAFYLYSVARRVVLLIRERRPLPAEPPAPQGVRDDAERNLDEVG